MLRKLAAVALCITTIASASDTQIASSHLTESSRRHNVTHGENVFKVNNQKVDLYLDRSLKDLSKAKLAKLLSSNRAQLHVRKIEDQYGLEIRHQLKGGGPLAGAIAYWATKTLCYGTAAAGASAVIVGTGGLAGAATGAASAAATLGASSAAGAVGTIIASAGLSTEAATVTVAVVHATGGMTAIGSTVAAVETTSMGISAFFTALPFLP